MLEIESQAALSLHDKGQLYRVGMELKDRLKTARKAAGLTQDDVAAEIGVTPQAVSGWERGETKPDADKYPMLAKLYNVDVAWLHGASDKEPNLSAPKTTRSAPVDLPARETMPRDLPVWGTAAGGTESDFTLSGGIIDYVRRPPGIARQNGVFALYVIGMSMSPKYEDGHLIFASSTRTPSIGDFVVVELLPIEEGGDWAGFIKRLVKRTPTKIVCEQFNPPKMVEFDLKRIKHVHRVIPLEELLGV